MYLVEWEERKINGRAQRYFLPRPAKMEKKMSGDAFFLN